MNHHSSYFCQVAELPSQSFAFNDSFLISFRCPEQLVETLRPKQQQFSTYQIEISQGQETEALSLVLSQSAITNFAVAPQPFDDIENMLHFRPHFALPPIPLPVTMVKRSAAVAAALHPPTLPAPFMELSLRLVNIGSVAIDRLLVSVQQLFHHLRVVHFGRGHYRAVRQAVHHVGAYVQLHAEKPVRTFARATHLGIMFTAGILGRAWRRDNGRVDNRARAQRQSLLLQVLLDFGKQLFRQPVPLQQMTKVQDRRFIRHFVLAQLDPRKPAHRFAVVKRFFHARVRQVEPLLQKVDAQHLLQPQRWSPIAGFRIVPLDDFEQLCPRHYLLHLFQKYFAPGFLLLISIGQRGKCWLTHSAVLLWLSCRHFNLVTD